MTQKQRKPVLVVEDDTTLNRLLVEQLSRIGFSARGVASRQQAIETLKHFEPSVAILDVRLPDSEGLEFLIELREHCPVVILTAYGSIDQAVKAVKTGAAEYLIKPVSPHRLDLAVNRALETAALKRDLQFLQEQVGPGTVSRMVGQSPAFNEMCRMIRLVSPADTTVLIEGESGVGKELVAKSIQEQSPRAAARFVAIDCCTLQENLFESELFGHERGAFTGADRKKEGLIEVAESGTVFLDEIGEISPSVQAKLLRVLETGKFRRVGGTRDLEANVRFIAATNRSLQEMCTEGAFRSDLYYRLSAFEIYVPPLRDRKSDIELIAQFFLAIRKFSRNVEKTLSVAAVKKLVSYDWPGNVRELRNVIERAVLVSGKASKITPEHISIHGHVGSKTAKVELAFAHEPTLDEIRDVYLVRLLETHNGNRQEVAKALGMSERNTYRLIKKLGLDKKANSTSPS